MLALLQSVIEHQQLSTASLTHAAVINLGITVSFAFGLDSNSGGKVQEVRPGKKRCDRPFSTAQDLSQTCRPVADQPQPKA